MTRYWVIIKERCIAFPLTEISNRKMDEKTKIRGIPVYYSIEDKPRFWPEPESFVLIGEIIYDPFGK